MRKTTIVYDGVSGGAFNGGRYLANAISSKGGSVIVIPSNAEFSAGDFAEAIVNVTGSHFYTIGQFLHGNYAANNGCSFDDSSLTVEICNVSFKTLSDIAERLCNWLKLDGVLIKDTNSGRVVLIET